MMMMMTRNDPNNRNDDGRSDQCNTATILSSPSKRRALVDENCVQIPPLDVLKLQQQQHPKLSSSSSSSSSLQKDGRSSGKSKSTGMKIPQQHHHQQEQIVWDLESAMIQLVRLNNIPLLLEQAVLEPVMSHDMQDHETATAATISSPSPPIPVDSTKVSLSSPSLSSSSSSSSTDKAPPQQQQQHPEYLTSDKDTWISFRMAHSGDAATIANWYHESELLKSAVAAEISSKQNKQVDSDIDAEDGDDDDDDDRPEIDTKPSPTATNFFVGCRNNIQVNHDDEDSTNNDASGTIASNSSLLELEHWLAEGLGDEVTCPSVFGLLCFAHSKDNNNKLEVYIDGNNNNNNSYTNNSGQRCTGKSLSNEENKCHHPMMMMAVVLLTVAWTSNERHLRVEWIGLHPSLGSDDVVRTTVQQRLWLRITALSVMTACPVIAVDKQFVVLTDDNINNNSHNTNTSKEKDDNKKTYSKPRIVPSAE
jgi:hypothetical protein